MADQDFILAPSTVKVNFKLNPVMNIHISLSLLNQVQSHSGFGQWVTETYQSMSPEQHHIGKLIWLAFSPITDLEMSFDDFPSYIEALASQDPIEAQERVMKMFLHKTYYKEHGKHMDGEPDLIEFPSTKDGFMEMVQDSIVPHFESKGLEADIDVFAEAYDRLQDPQGLLETIVEYYQSLWNNFIKKEWERNLPSLEDSVDAFNMMDYSGMTAIEAARAVTGRDLSMYGDSLESAEEITFVPNHHVGPYVTMWSEKNHATITFGARIPKGAKTQSIALNQSELLVRLNALADDNRLSILELLTRHDEMCAQDIMIALDLTQSSASRHLRQLTATGYLVERRREVAKCYSLNSERVDDTLHALKQFLKRK